MALNFIETIDATDGLECFSAVTGTVSVSTEQPMGGRNSVKCAGTSGAAAHVTRSGALSASGGRVPVRIRLSALPASGVTLCNLVGLYQTPPGGSPVIGAGVYHDGRVFVSAGGDTAASAVGTLVADTDYCLVLCYSITNTTVWTVKLFFGAAGAAPAELLTLSNAGTLPSALMDTLRIGWIDEPGQTANLYFRNIVTDDDASLTSPGEVRATAKLSGAVNANNFDVTGGTGAVNERPLSLTNYMRQAGSAQVSQSYGIQGAGAGDVDLTGATLLGYSGFAYAKKGVGTGTPSYVNAFGAALTSATTVCAVTVSGLAAGDSIIVFAAANTATLTGWSCTDNGTTPTYNADEGPTKAAGTLTAVVFSRHDISGSMPTTVTVTFPASGLERSVKVVVIRGMAISSVLDVSPTATNFTSSATTTAPASGTLAQAQEIVLGFYAWLGEVGDTFTANTDWTAAGANAGTTSGGTDTVVNGVYQITVGTGSVQPSANLSGSRAGVSFTVSYKAGDAAPASPKLILDGTEYDAALTTSAALYRQTVTSGSYPADAATIGMKSTGTTEDTDLYECGLVVAYIPGAPPSGFGSLLSSDRNRMVR